MSRRRYARIAGFLYLLIIVFGISSEVLVRASLIVPEDPSLTANNILANPSLFRLGFLGDSIMLLADGAIAVLFYVLFKPVNNLLALTATVFRLLQTAILGTNLLHYYAALLLLTNNFFLEAFNTIQLNSLVGFFLDLHSYGYDLGLIFFGASNLILGYLVIKSNEFPTWIGILIITAAAIYLLGSYTRFLYPDYLSFIEPLYIIPLISELSFCLWLLLKGIIPNDQTPELSE